MSVAIVTKYHGPTNYRGSRVTASVPSRIADCDPERAAESPNHRPSYWRLTVSWDHALGPEENHAAAARALARRLDWPADELRGGSLPDGYAFVFCA